MNENLNLDLGLEKIARLWISNYKNPKRIYRNLRGILKMKELWYASYIKVQSNKGSHTSGIDSKTLDSITKEKLDKLREKVIRNKFEWNAIKRVEIPKNNNKIRKLGIPTLRDRIVQEVLRSILEPIFEPTFSENNHGFRPGRSCHTALKFINTQFKAASWCIEGDISNYFDSINHNILLHILRRKIRDNLILNLIENGLKADIIWKNKQINHISGTTQGGILSPLLSNIYLNELDQYMKILEKKYLGPKEKAKANPAYTKLMNKRTKGWNPKLARKLKINKYYPFDPEYYYIRYVRYADDFLVGIIGSIKLGIEIKEEIRKFLLLKLKLTLNMKKTKITNVSKKVPFLGYLIGRRMIMTKQRYGKKNKLVPRKCVIPILDGDIKKMVLNLSENGFCDKSGLAKPNFSLLMLPQSEINSRINSIIRGISNWWAIARNRRQAIAYISYILRYSAAKLYAAKFKLGSIAKVFKLGGKDLSKPLSKHKKSVVGVTDDWINNWFNKSDMKNTTAKKKKRIIEPILYTRYKDIPDHIGNKQKFDWEPDFVNVLKNEEKIKDILKLMVDNKITSIDNNPLKLLGWRMGKGVKVLGESCFVCGENKKIEMHHVKSIKQLKPLKNMIKDKQRAILRKQIPLCRKHHLQIHKNNWKNSPMLIQELIENESIIKPDDIFLESIPELKIEEGIVKPGDVDVINSVEVGEPSDG
jgi:group II intron reverse transcriptase/maturase